MNPWLAAVLVAAAFLAAPRAARRVTCYFARPTWRGPDDGRCPTCDGWGDEERVYGYETCDTCAGTGQRPDSMLSPADAAALWRSARTLDDLGQLTARWLRGELPTALAYGGPADDETSEIRDVLVAFNEAGWLTEFSQPGHDWVTGWDGETQCRQRAAVTFLVDDDGAAVLAAEALRAGLWLDARLAPSVGFVEDLRARYGRLPVSEARGPDGVAWMSAGVGFVYPRSHWRWIGRTWRSRRIGRLLAGAWQVTVVDLEWGEPDRLWLALARGLPTSG
jgi:hypothetical protein